MPRRKTKSEVIEQDFSLALPPEVALSPRSSDLQRLVDMAVTEQDWIAVFRCAKDRALDGNVKWAEFLAKYKWGMPPQMVEHKGGIGVGIKVVEIIRTEARIEDVIEGEVKES